MKYHLCYGDNVNFFINEINRYLSAGWILHGQTYRDGNWNYQAVILVNQQPAGQE